VNLTNASTILVCDNPSSTSSQAIDAGDLGVVQAGWVDFDGLPRTIPQGSLVDIGGSEYGSTAPAALPASAPANQMPQVLRRLRKDGCARKKMPRATFNRRRLVVLIKKSITFFLMARPTAKAAPAKEGSFSLRTSHPLSFPIPFSSLRLQFDSAPFPVDMTIHFVEKPIPLYMH
jgi:hypothetical protein